MQLITIEGKENNVKIFSQFRRKQNSRKNRWNKQKTQKNYIFKPKYITMTLNVNGLNIL